MVLLRRLALKLQVEALSARRVFWETLLHSRVTFRQMAHALERIETSVRACERMYRQVRR